MVFAALVTLAFFTPVAVTVLANVSTVRAFA